MRTLRAIFLAGVILALAGSAFADKGGIPNSNSNGKGKDGGTYAAPELNLNHPLEYGLLAIAGAAWFCLSDVAGAVGRSTDRLSAAILRLMAQVTARNGKGGD